MYDATFHIIIFGDATPGREMFVHKSLTNLFVSDQTMTIGVDFEVKSLSIDGQKIKLSIWMLGGEERFRFLLPTYVRGKQGGLFLYDVTKYSSLAHMDDWLSIIRKELEPEDRFPIIVVGIIPDEECERQVTREEGIKIAKSRNLNAFIECNPKTGKNVEKAFEALTRLMLAGIGHERRIKRERRKKEEEFPTLSGERANIRKRRIEDGDRYPYPYVFKPPSPPDDLALAPRTQLRQPPKKKDTEEKIHCQYCGMELTEEKQFTHSCKNKPKNK